MGGAVVADSTAHGEYEECLVKARYFTEARRPIGLIETLHYSPARGFERADRHFARMARSAAALGLPFDAAFARMTMEAVRGPKDLRVRLSLDETGHFACFAEELAEPDRIWRYAVSERRVMSADALNRHKTDWRELYEGEFARLRTQTGCDEAIFLNERDEIVEGSRTNIFVRKGGRLVTPPLASGPLPGCLRQDLIDAGDCTEGILTPADLEAAEAIYLGNSLRGLIEARPVALSAKGGSDDPQTEIGRIPALFAQKKSEDRQAAQSGHLQIPRRRRKARARGAVFQAPLKPRSTAEDDVVDQHGRVVVRRHGAQQAALEDGVLADPALIGVVLRSGPG